MQFTTQMATSRVSESCLSQPAWTTTTKRREQNRIYLYSGKSEANLALDVLLSKLLMDTKHRAASLRQQSYLYLMLLRNYLLADSL